MTKKYLFSVVLYLFTVATVYPQIKVEINSISTDEEYTLYIESDTKNYYLTLKIREDLLQNKKYLKDARKHAQEYTEIRRRSPTHDSLKIINRKLQRLKERDEFNKVYKTEFPIAANLAYHNLIDEIKTSNKEDLERNEGDKDIVTLDGDVIKIFIHDGELLKEVNTHSPTRQSHPLVYGLLSETLSIFRNKKLISEEIMASYSPN